MEERKKVSKRQLAVEVFPKGRNLCPKRNQLVTPSSQETIQSPRKRGNYLLRRSHSAVDLKKLLSARAVAPRKRKSSKSYPRRLRNGHFFVTDISLAGHNTQRYFPTRPISQ